MISILAALFERRVCCTAQGRWPIMINTQTNDRHAMVDYHIGDAVFELTCLSYILAQIRAQSNMFRIIRGAEF